MSKFSVRNFHRPIHLQIKGSLYFVSTHTLDDQNIFNSPIQRQIFIRVLNHAVTLYQVKIYAWVLWPNHYHLLFGIEEEMVDNFIKNLHSYTAKLINQVEGAIGRRVWFQYWDRLIRNRADFFRHISYILENPIKHGWCHTYSESYQYPWSSNPWMWKNYGSEWLDECLRRYPVVDWSGE